jgi:thiamine-phosphate pyrophosphorylase
MPGPVDGGGIWRRRRLEDARLYVVTGARQDRGDLEPFLQALLEAGADIVQLREKDAEAGDLLRWGEAFRAATARHGALFVVNDRPDVALALEADGVHLGQNDLPAAFARDLVGPDVLIGLSTHDAAQLRSASPHADYVSVGPIHETPTKPGRQPTGLGLVREAAMRERRPWFAIGGIDAQTLPAVREAGARRIVVVRAVTEAADPGQAVRRLLAGLEIGDGDGGS